MAKKVFNMAGGLHSAAAYTAFENRLYGGSVKASADSFLISAGAGMNVSVSKGDGLIDTGSEYARRVQLTAVETVLAPAANASFNRIDSVVMYIDNAVVPTTGVIDNINDVLKLMVVAGTAAATPAAPTGAAIQAAIGAGNPYMVLGNVTIPQAATNLAAATFTQLATVALQSSWLDLSKLTTLSYSAWTAATRIGVLGTTQDLRERIQPGTRISIYQATGGWKYGIVHAVTATLVHVLWQLGTTLNNESVQFGRYSGEYAPQGFNPSEDQWRFRIIPAGNTNNTPSKNVWYMPNALNTITFGIGKWLVSYTATPRTAGNASSWLTGKVTVSNATSTEPYPNFTLNHGKDDAANGTITISSSMTILREPMTVAAGTQTLNLLHLCDCQGTVNATNGFNPGGYLEAVSAYL